MKFVPWSILCILSAAVFSFSIPIPAFNTLGPALPGFLFGSVRLRTDDGESSFSPEDLAPQADKYFIGDNSALSSSKWGTSAAGPFTATFMSGDVANFAVVDGRGISSALTVSGLNVTENFTITGSGSVFSSSGTVLPVNVSLGKTLNMGTHSIGTGTTTGVIKNGQGVLATIGGTFKGGFTLNAGTVVALASNALGSGTGNTLTINGGTLATDSERDFSGKFPGGIFISGDFQIGVSPSEVPLAVGDTNLIFSNAVSLGASTRTITIGHTNSGRFTGPISGASGTGLRVVRNPGGLGAVVLVAANTYTGPTTAESGTLAVVHSMAVANSSAIEIGADGNFNIRIAAGPLVMTAGQTLRAVGTTSSGKITTMMANGLTTAANSPIEFTAFNGSVPPLTISGPTNLTLAPGNPVTVTISHGGEPLGPGDHKLISRNPATAGVVSGLPTTVTVNGDGVAGTPSLVLLAGELYLRVTAVIAPDISVTPSSRDFGVQPLGQQSAEMSYTLRNDGNAPLVVGPVVSSNPSEFFISTDPNGAVLAVGSTATLGVRFTPSIEGGRTANISIGSNDPDENPLIVTASGNGIAPDTTPPVISYTPLANTSTAQIMTFPVNVTDNVGINSVSVTWDNPDNGTQVTEPCTFVTGTQWNCQMSSSLVNLGAISYLVSASDAAGNGSVNPANGTRNLFTNGASGTIDTSLYASFDTVHLGSGWTFLGNARVETAIDIEGNVHMAGNTLTLGCDSSFVGAGQGAYVIGKVTKEICGLEVFTFPVGTVPDNAFAGKRTEGTPQEYSPFTVEVTAVNGKSSLTVSANDEVMNGMYAAHSVSRWWDVLETGDVTANISFTWLDGDVSGSESNFKVIRRQTFSQVYEGTSDATTNTASAQSVSEFGGWSAGFLVPTAAAVSLSGRIQDFNSGRGIANAIVEVKGMDGSLAGAARTGSFGYFTVEGLTAGQSYTVYISAKRYTFTPQVINMFDSVDRMVFTAEPLASAN